MATRDGSHWASALAVLVTLQGLAWAWGRAVAVTPPWDFEFARPERSRVFMVTLLLFLVGNTWCLVRVLPERFRGDRWSLPVVLRSLAFLPLFALAVLAAGGVVDGVNDLLPRAPEERRTGVVAGFLHAANGRELTVVRLGERETLELALPRALTSTLQPESAVALELHHGALFTWGRVQRLGPPARPDARPPGPP